LFSIKHVGRAGPKILLLHGLYSSSGAWIPVLKSFKDFRLTLVTIDYHKAILADAIPDLIKEVSLNLKGGFDIAIGHSFGSLILYFLDLDSSKNIFIAPPFVSSKFYFERYIKFVSSATEFSEDDINFVVERAINISKSSIFKLCATDEIFLPLSDEFFTYDQTIHPVQYFAGSHSDLESAITFVFSKRKTLC
jgi:hypothetical protein